MDSQKLPIQASNDQKDVAIQVAFELGWNLAELNARIRSSSITRPSSSRRMLALWRVILFKIGSLHAKAFKVSSTAKTLYELPANQPAYLFPDAAADYVMINTAADPTAVPDLKAFAIYETSLRAINCLCLLYLDPDEWLASDDIKKRQNAIRQQMQNLEDPETVLGTFACKILNAWNDYVREHYFAGGMIENSAIESVAFEAGRMMASISWEITAASLRFESILDENAEEDGPATTRSPTKLTDNATDASTSAEEIEKAWNTAFRPEVIIRLQHFISEISSELSTTVDAAARLKALESVKKSIEYWARAVTHQKTLFAPSVESSKSTVANPPPDPSTEAKDRIRAWKKLRLALTRQANIWESLMIGQQDLNAFDVESVCTAPRPERLEQDSVGPSQSVLASGGEYGSVG